MSTDGNPTHLIGDEILPGPGPGALRSEAEATVDSTPMPAVRAAGPAAGLEVSPPP